MVLVDLVTVIPVPALRVTVAPEVILAVPAVPEAANNQDE